MSLYESLLQVDFENVYKTYADNLARKNQLFRFTTYFIIAPYLVTISLISTKNLSLDALSNLNAIPPIIYLVALITGVGMLLPLFQFVENDDNLMRCARAINNFRKLYNNSITANHEWSVNLPTNMSYPKERYIFSSGTITFLIFYSVSTLYYTTGTFGLLNNKIFSLYHFIALFIFESIGILIYFKTGKSKEFTDSDHCERDA